MGKVGLALLSSWENSGWPPGRPNPSPGPENPSANVCSRTRDGPWQGEKGRKDPNWRRGDGHGQGDATMSMIWLQNSCRMTMILEGVL